MSNENVTLHIAVLNALTNLTTLEESHDVIIVHINTLGEVLQKCKILQIKVKKFVAIYTLKNLYCSIATLYLKIII